MQRNRLKQPDLTIIGGGVQMIPERGMPLMLEDFKRVNRMRMFELLKKNKMDNVVFISGDVHSGQIF